MAFNPDELRDYHGRWSKEAGLLHKALGELKSSGKISSGEHRLATIATVRHLKEKERSLPHANPHDNLAHIAEKTRMDAVAHNKELPRVAQQLRKQARAVESAHRALTTGSATKAGEAKATTSLKDSPGRGPGGQLRNFKAMADAKLLDVIAQLDKHGDPEAGKAARAEAARRKLGVQSAPSRPSRRERRAARAAKKRSAGKPEALPAKASYRAPDKLPASVNDLKAELDKALAAGATKDELMKLDPSARQLPAGTQVGHAQQHIFDLALGKHNGVKQEVRAVSDAQYRARLEKEGKFKSREEIQKKTPYKIDFGSYGSAYIKELFPNDPNIKEYGKKGGLRYELSPEGVTYDDPALHRLISVASYFNLQRARDWKKANPKGSLLDYAEQETSLGAASSYSRRVRQRRDREVSKAYEGQFKRGVRKLRKQEGTASWSFSLPTYDRASLKPQTWDSIGDHMKVASAGASVPSFHTAAKVEDGVLYHRGPGAERRRLEGATNGTVIKAADQSVSDALLKAGAAEAVNSKNIDPGYKGRGAIYAGTMLSLAEGEPPKLDEVAATTKARNYARAKARENALDKVAKKYYGELASHLTQEKLSRPDAVKVAAQAERATEDWINQRLVDPTQPHFARFYQQTLKATHKEAVAHIRNIYEPPLPEKRVEYVPHSIATEVDQEAALRSAKRGIGAWFGNWGLSQEEGARMQTATSVDQLRKMVDQAQFQSLTGQTLNPDEIHRELHRRIDRALEGMEKQQAPRSQRGRLTLHGYTPEEAAKKLQELGVVGPLESHVPFGSIMRSNRREGLVLPLHPAYVRGEAQLPETKHLVTHGISGSGDVMAILEGGGLHSIAERYRRGIAVRSASPAGDIRSGIDHVVFGSLDSGSTVGSSSSVRFGFKPEALLRRDMIMAPRDFGGMGSRYEHYKGYLNKLQQRAKEPTTSLYQPASPAVRQKHLRSKQNRPGSSEINIGGSVPIEDIKVIGVQDKSMADKVTGKLQELYGQGKITQIPQVVVGRAEFHSAVGGTPAPGGLGF